MPPGSEDVLLTAARKELDAAREELTTHLELRAVPQPGPVAQASADTAIFEQMLEVLNDAERYGAGNWPTLREKINSRLR